MILKLPLAPLYILHAMQAAGFQAYIVGGAVRDTLINDQIATDFDFTTDATPDEIKKLFPESYYENDFGTVSITHTHLMEQAGISQLQSNDNQDTTPQINISSATKIHPSLKMKQSTSDTALEPAPYEITTFRTDGEYEDFRRPKQVSWGTSLEEDLERRDFTINAMAISIDAEYLKSLFLQEKNSLPEELTLQESEFTLIDPHNGKIDLEQKIIRTVGDPHQRFKEDALRMLRAIRFCVQLNFAIEPNTIKAIQEHAQLLRHISGERVRVEFFKMLISRDPKAAIEMLDSSGLLEIFLPELLQTKNVQQGGHHTTDVWTHSLDALAESPSDDPVVKLATLLHDISKPTTFAKTPDGDITFYNHEVVGARVGKTVAERLKLSKKDIERMFLLIRFHMFHYQPEQTDAAIRRFMRRVGLDNLNDILDLREADRLGSGARKTSWRLEEMKERMNQQLNQPFDVNDLAIDGDNLINDLQLQPGPQFKEILQQLLEIVLEEPEKNNKDFLLEKAKELSSTNAS